jgi:transposase
MQDDEARRVVLAMLARGLMRPADAARHAGVSRQLVNKWVRAKGINWERVLYAVQRKHWNREMKRGPRLVETGKTDRRTSRGR